MSPHLRYPGITYRPDIDGMRALAVGIVLLFHAFPTYCRAGFIGVDIFFVISGYLITSIILADQNSNISFSASVLDFYKRRIRRIFPALIVVLLASGAYGWFVILPVEMQSLTKYIAGGAAFVTNFLLWAEAGYFDREIELKPLMHLWSLAIEEQFYIVWPLLILSGRRSVGNNRLALLIGILVLASFSYGLFLTFSDPTASYYSPLSRGWELGIGGFLAILHARGIASDGSSARKELVTAAALGLILLGAFFFIDPNGFPGWQALLPVMCTAALIWFARGTWIGRHVLGARAVVYIGLVSYPLYLWHWVLLSFLRIHDPLPPGTERMAAIGASVLLAVATYHFVERPIRRLNLRVVSLSASALMLAIFAAGVAAHRLELSGVHLTPTQVALSQVYDPQPDYRYKACFLDPLTQSSVDFAPECSESGKPGLLIWGDSLAAQLYPGLMAARPEPNYAIVQRTAGSCAPSMQNRSIAHGSCDEINASTRRFIEETRPAAAIINGRWPQEENEREAQIAGVVEFLKANGAQIIVLVGPAPDWMPDLRNILIRKSFPDGTLPHYMPPPPRHWRQTVKLDTHLRMLAADFGIRYLSLVERFCRADQCLIRVSDQIPNGLISSDHDHLTAQASAFLFKGLNRESFWSRP